MKKELYERTPDEVPKIQRRHSVISNPYNCTEDEIGLIRRGEKIIERFDIDTAIQLLGECSITMGRPQHRDISAGVVEAVSKSKWTMLEWELALAEITNPDAELLEHFKYNKKIVGTEAINLVRTRPRVRAGRLFTHGEVHTFCNAGRRAMRDLFTPVRVEGDKQARIFYMLKAAHEYVEVEPSESGVQ